MSRAPEPRFTFSVAKGLKPRPLGRNEWADPRNNALATLQEGMLDEWRWAVCPEVHNFVGRSGLEVEASEKQSWGEVDEMALRVKNSRNSSREWAAVLGRRRQARERGRQSDWGRSRCSQTGSK
jgi:hypothetical protein